VSYEIPHYAILAVPQFEFAGPAGVIPKPRAFTSGARNLSRIKNVLATREILRSA